MATASDIISALMSTTLYALIAPARARPVCSNRHPYADQHREKVAIYRKGPARRPAQIWCVNCGAINTDPKCRSPRALLRDPVPLPCSGRGQQPIRSMRAVSARSSGIQRSILDRLPSMGASQFLSWPVSSVAGGQSVPDARRRFDIHFPSMVCLIVRMHRASTAQNRHSTAMWAIMPSAPHQAGKHQ